MADLRLPARAGYGYIPGLDGLRCLAVMMVIVAHAGFDHIVPGGLGVTVFFFISGFLITRLLLAETVKDGQVGLGKFYIRRFLRLLPALYVMLVITWVILVAMGTPPRPVEVATAFTYTANYLYTNLAFQDFAAAAGTGVPGVRVAPWEHLWSLAIEEHFYLLFPLLIVMCRNHLKRLIWICLFLCVAALIWRLTTLHVLGWPPKYNYAATDARIDSLVWGCLLSIMLHLKPEGAWRKWLTGALPLAIAAGLMLFTLLYRDTAFRETFRYSIQGVALFVGVLNLYFWRPMDWAIGLLELSVPAWIGRVSYGLYLWHMPVFAFTHDWTGLNLREPLFILVGVAATFIVTALSFYIIERPIVALRRRFGSHVVKR